MQRLFQMVQRLYIKPKLKTVNFGDTKARLLEVLPDTNPSEAIQNLDLDPYKAAIVIHSGAGGFTDEYYDKLCDLFESGFTPFVQDNRVLVIDGATNAGCGPLVGKARRKINGTFPFVGVTISSSITYPGGPDPADGRWELEPNHSHFIVVRASEFGAESPLMTGLVHAWRVPHLALIVNGGSIVQKEAEMHAQNDVPLLVLKGSGRFADELAASTPGSELRANYPKDAVIEIFDAEMHAPEEFRKTLNHMLFA